MSDAHFGGGILTKTGKEGAMSHKDLIEQLISESKKRRAEKQMTKAATTELTEKLDSEWKDLLPIVSKIKKGPNDSEIKQKQDNYDKVMRELKFEARGNPTNRLKSEDEIAKEEKTKLEKLEQDRLDRMREFTDKTTEKKTHRSADDLDDNFEVESDTEMTVAYDEEGNLKTGETCEKNAQNEEEEMKDEEEEEESSEAETEDDLSDLKESESDSDLEEEIKHKKGTEKMLKISEVSDTKIKKLANKGERKLCSQKEEIKIKTGTERVVNISEVSDTKSKKPEHENKRKLCAAEEEIKDETTTERVLKISEVSDTKIDHKRKLCAEDVTKTEKKRKLSDTKTNLSANNDNNQDLDVLKITEAVEKAKNELPYTYKLPDSYENLQSTLSNQPAEYQGVIIERMIKCNHPSLAAENKENLGKLFIYLLQHLNDVVADSTDDMKNCFSVLNSLTPHLYDLTQLNPQNALNSLIEVIKEKQSDYKNKLKSFPGVDVLLFLKLVSCLFSTSDFRHQVVTPSLVFISQMLTNCRVKTRYDVSFGLFLVTLYLEVSQYTVFLITIKDHS